MSNVQLKVGHGDAERVSFVGDTRSGKTTLMQFFLASLGSAVVVDSKHVDDEWLPFARKFGYFVTADPNDIRRHPRVLFRVDAAALADSAGWRKPGSDGWSWTVALRSIIARGNTVAVIDESMHCLPSQGALHPDARRIVTQGAGMGIPVWLGTQAPVYVDPLSLTQSEHMFSMRYEVDDYLRKLKSLRGIDTEILRTLDAGRYQFAHHRKGDREWSVWDGITPVTKATTSPRARSKPIAPEGNNVAFDGSAPVGEDAAMHPAASTEQPA